MYMNPICKKEWKLSVRTKKLAIGLFAFNAILSIIGLLVFWVSFSAEGANYAYINYVEIHYVYIIITAIEVILVSFIIPSITAGSIAGERERQTLEILLTTKLTTWQIVWGKLISSISTTLLYVISGLPIFGLVFIIGGIEVVDILEIIAYIFVLAIYLGSIGIFFSSLLKKTIGASVCTYGIGILLSFGIFVILNAVYIILESQAYSAVTYVEPDIGHITGLALLSPVYSVIALMTGQIGGSQLMEGMFSQKVPWCYFTPNSWFLTSIAIQLVVSVILLYIAAKRINPIKKAKVKKEKRSKKEEKSEPM